ncbi:CdaR family transcriptional regulator [Adlercreutzia sp. ZJ473]|uniref:PucR family transcriptional regulator n=1 Tax=Adlercreutzia sp. ZJ473 TaxID=2722822 RepID=UPI00155557C8|nr:helix-turn-helix domain-containing protein [Adlercreutzia sp. ZJ473]
MQFPLDVITGYFDENDMRVTKHPRHPKDLFSWVSAFCDDDAPGIGVAGIEGKPVYVVESRGTLPENACCVIVSKPGESISSSPAGARADDICVESALEPAVIADRIQRYLMGIIQWNDVMGDMIESECICQDLLKASEPVLKSYVGLSDSTYSYIAHTPNIAPIDDTSRYFIENKFYSSDALSKAREKGLVRTWAHQDWTTVHNEPNEITSHPSIERVFRLNDAYAAHLVMVSEKPISTAQVFLFNLLAKRVEMCLTHHWRLENPLEQRYTYFLKELLTGNTYDGSYLEERALLHGLPLTGLFEMCLIDNTWRAGSASYFAKKVLETDPNCKVAFEGSRVVVLLCTPEPRRGRIAGMEERLFELAGQMRLEVGVSDRYEHIDQSALALEKARIALKYGHRRSRRYTTFDQGLTAEGVFRFRRYFPYFVTDPFSRSEKFVAKLLSSPNPLSMLREADRERGTSDFEILRTYLYCEGSIKKVCDIMHMHRNTVSYRLDKIRDAIATDLEDPDMRMYLRTLYLLNE